MSTEDNKAVVRRYLDEVWNKGNVGIIDELMAPNYARHIGTAPPVDREAQKARITRIVGALSDLRLTIEDTIAEGDRVVIRLTVRGIQSGPFMGIPATGKPVTMTGIDIACLADGKVVEHWGEMDTYALIQQLGLLVPQRT